MQKSVKAILCLGVVSVSLFACDPKPVDETIVQLDQLNDQILDIDSIVEDTMVYDDVAITEPVGEDLIEKEVE